MAGALPALLPATPRRVLAVCGASNVPAYDEALEGLRATLGAQAVRVVTLDQLGKGERICTLAAYDMPGVVIAVGSTALNALSDCSGLAPLLATMVLPSGNADRAGAGNHAVVTLEIPPDTLLQRIRRMYPGGKRLALVRGPALSSARANDIQILAKRAGIVVELLPCPGPRELLDSIQFLDRPFDFLWCLPDPALYQGPTIPALVLSAMRRRLPIIGFSEGMVRAGALVGFYPDYKDIGSQTGELVLRRLDGLPCPPRTSPRKVKTAINERVMRALGIHATPVDRVEVLQ